MIIENSQILFGVIKRKERYNYYLTGRDVIWSGNVKLIRDQFLSSGSKTKMYSWSSSDDLSNNAVNVIEGFPVWIKFVPSINFRIDNGPFKIKNEYGSMVWELKAPDKS
ncbi:uncharacterized protein LOC124890988 [Capsicum annuum]|uniref:uncharacterized protein LOC124890988 n=1 Tax=Capsicum annuum TaxID=4072 RepID=UPI001FB0A7C2|nr:uncharacterized protein LOC124890988 [Capsicum annuum]